MLHASAAVDRSGGRRVMHCPPGGEGAQGCRSERYLKCRSAPVAREPAKEAVHVARCRAVCRWREARRPMPLPIPVMSIPSIRVNS